MKLVVSKFHDPSYNLALEEILFSDMQDEFALFYVNSPSVIIGCNQILQNEVDEDLCRVNNIPVIRRISGGGAVYHDLGNLTYSFIRNKIDKAHNLNTEFLNSVVYALKSIGVEAVIGKRKDLWLPDGFKISGTAAHLTAKRVLYHGTLLYNTDLSILNNSLSSPNKKTDVKGIQSVPSPVKNIKSFLEENNLPIFNTSDFYKIIIRNIKDFCHISEEFHIDERFTSKIETSMKEKYLNNNWNKKK
ncbi:hypothetical protein MASR2M117_07120 [Paludibacter sp.]